jgi:hypothetical protein
MAVIILSFPDWSFMFWCFLSLFFCRLFTVGTIFSCFLIFCTEESTFLQVPEIAEPSCTKQLKGKKPTRTKNGAKNKKTAEDRGEDFLDIDQSETKIACGGHVC